MKKICIFIFIISLLILFGCSSDGDKTGVNDSNKDAIETQAKVTESEAVECNWIMEVDDTKEGIFEGIKFEYTLTILAEKKGGIDETGTYKGKVYLKTVMDIPSLNEEFGDDTQVAGNNQVDSTADQAVIEVKSYDPGEYVKFGLKEELQAPFAPIAPVADNGYMALVNLEMTHRQYWNLDLTFDEGEQANSSKDTSFNAPVAMKFIIEGGQLNVSIPSLKASQTFKGIVTGNTISNVTTFTCNYYIAD